MNLNSEAKSTEKTASDEAEQKAALRTAYALPSPQEIAWAGDCMTRIVDNVSRVVFGKEDSVRKILAAFCAGGHVLLEDQPGVGKTLIARAIARSLRVEAKRIQYTPDVVPSDVTGTVVFSRREEEFKFREGPVFTNLLLADEVNRGTPRTQSALLEAMEERAVTVEGVRYKLPTPFFVIATQNPLELHGTFPLPESQLDRFMLKLSIGFPSIEYEDQMLRTYCRQYPLDTLEAVVKQEELRRLLGMVSSIYIHADIRGYLLELVEELRNDPRVRMGVSPRGSLNLARASQAWALLNGRHSVLPDDIKELAVSVLAHRVVPHSHSDDSVALVKEILGRVPVPVLPESNHGARRQS